MVSLVGVVSIEWGQEEEWESYLLQTPSRTQAMQVVWQKPNHSDVVLVVAALVVAALGHSVRATGS